MARRRYRRKKLSLTSIILSIILLLIIIAGYYVYNTYFKEEEPFIEAKGDISFHFVMLGNEYAGDCVYVKAGENDILIDAGSNTSSIDDIENYLNKYVTDDKLEYVIVTHAHEDHIAGFAKENGSLFDLFEVGVIIDFPKTESTSKLYSTYQAERSAEVSLGAKHYNALDCYNNINGGQRIFNLSDDGNIKLEILYNYFYDHDASTENNYSVCVQFHHGPRKFIFTGDLEEKGEEYLVDYNDLSKVELYKAGHHGSSTSSCEKFMSAIKPNISVAQCCAGSVEYSDDIKKGTFPTQSYIDAIAPYTEKVYVPITIDIVQVEGQDTPSDTSDDKYDNKGNYQLLNGNIVVISEESGVMVECSNNATLLKDTAWFKNYRTLPNDWKVA